MSDIDNIYFEEASELLESMESALMSLESTDDKQDAIEEIFRAMHTLKGNSSMFGLDNVANFLHNLETIYDKIRDGQLEASKGILDCSLSSVDHIKKLIIDFELNDAELRKVNDQLTKELLSFLDDDDTIKDENSSQPIQPKEAGGSGTYYLKLVPDESVLQNGTNLLSLVAEIVALGKTRVFPKFRKLENIENFIPTNNYSAWEFILNTSVGLNEIRDVFVFVEDESEIQIEKLSDQNLLDNKEFSVWINEHFSVFDFEYISLSDIKSVADKIVVSSEEVEVVQEVEIDIKEEDNVEKKEKIDIKKLKKNIASIRVSSDKLDGLLNIVSELVTTQASLSLHSDNNYSHELELISENVERLSRQLRDVAFGMTLIPLKSIMNRFQRLVRDISSSLGKTVDFQIIGDDTELDKNIIEQLTDPLMHILRNSLDHGIEIESERIKKGKPANGTIVFKAYYSGASVHIQIKDDGKGIDTHAIRDKAIQKGIISSDTVLSEKEIFDLMFAPGFSTAKEVTGVSGRGVGMDVVRKNISFLRGEIDVNSELGVGTTITIKLPLSLSIIDGLLVKIGEDHYIILLTVIEKCFEISHSQLLNTFNRVIVLDDEQMPFINLREEFNKGDTDAPDFSSVVVVRHDEERIGIVIDAIVGEYQAVLKPIGKYYQNQDFISGATILGDGTVALVLDTLKIIELKTKNNAITV